jgi:predicted transcriptional regulator
MGKIERVMIALRPEVKDRLDRMAKDMHMTRSGLITFMVEMQSSLDENKDLNKLMETAFKGIMKKLSKP